MRISAKEATSILVILGLALFAMVYFLLYTPIFDETEALKKETEGLRPRLEKLREYKESEHEYEVGVAEAQKLMAEIVGTYPHYVLEENILLYVVEMEEQYRLNISSISFGSPWNVRSFDIYTDEGPKSMSMYATDFSMEGNFGYGSIKDFIRAIPAETERTALNQISMSYNATDGRLSGSISMRKYFVSDGTESYVAPLIPDIRYGVRDLFGSVSDRFEPVMIPT